MASPPFVFIHQGKSWFVPFALHQARWSDPSSSVVLLGDGDRHKGVHSLPIGHFSNRDSEHFSKVFKVMSLSPVGHELIWYLRWFYLLEWMKKEDLEDAIYFDSDVLNYSKADVIKAAVEDRNGKCGITVLSQPEDSFMWTGCGHSSYWKRAALEEFCDFCIETYTSPEYLKRYGEKMAWHVDRGLRGGVCDMTTLYLFWERHRDQVINLAIAHQGAVVDHNVGSSTNFYEGEYLMNGRIKKIEFLEKRPYLFPASSLEPVLAHSLHFQGERKRLMPQHYTGEWFPGRYSRQLNLAVRSLPRRFRQWVREKG